MKKILFLHGFYASGQCIPATALRDVFYRYFHSAFDSETKERVVVYQALYGDKQYWVRPERMFFENIERDGRQFARFTETDPIKES